MRSWKGIFLMFLVVFVASCSNAKTEDETTQYDKPDKFTVKTMVVNKEVREAKITFSGTVTSDKTVMLMPKIMGYIENINADIGDSFRKNDVLVSISSDELNARLKRAQSAVKEARIGLKQAESGVKMAQMKKRKAKA